MTLNKLVSGKGEWQPIETAPHAMHFLAAYFDASFGEWICSVQMRPDYQLNYPWTHWTPLPDMPEQSQ